MRVRSPGAPSERAKSTASAMELRKQFCEIHMVHTAHATHTTRVGRAVFIIALVVAFSTTRVREDAVRFDYQFEFFLVSALKLRGENTCIHGENERTPTLSGWCLRLSRRYPFLISDSEQSRGIPANTYM